MILDIETSIGLDWGSCLVHYIDVMEIYNMWIFQFRK